MVALVAFVVYDVRHAALAYLGINPAKPAVEFEIRLPKAALTAIADTQVELLTDRNQKLAKVQDALASTSDGRSVLKGTVTLDYRTTERMVVLNLPGQSANPVQAAAAGQPDAFRQVRAVASGRRHHAREGRHGDAGDARRLRDPLPRAVSSIAFSVIASERSVHSASIRRMDCFARSQCASRFKHLFKQLFKQPSVACHRTDDGG